MEPVTGHSPQTKGVTVLHGATTFVLCLRLLSLCPLVKVGHAECWLHAMHAHTACFVQLFRQLDLHAHIGV